VQGFAGVAREGMWSKLPHTDSPDGDADLVRRYPDRFLGYVSLPLPHVDASLAEMRRGMDELGMCGVAMNCSVFDRSIAEQEFEPLYVEMDRRGAVLYFHPSGNGICSPMVNDYGLGAVGTLMEDTVLALHLIVRQIPHRFPNIKVIISHLGGMLPVSLNRLDQINFDSFTVICPSHPASPLAASTATPSDTVHLPPSCAPGRPSARDSCYQAAIGRCC